MVEEPRRRAVDNTTIPVIFSSWFTSDVVVASALDHIVDLKHAMDTILTASNDTKEEARRAALRVFPFRAAIVDLALLETKVTPTLTMAVDRVLATPGLQFRDVHYDKEQKIPRAIHGAFVEKILAAGFASYQKGRGTAAELQISYRHGTASLSAMSQVQLLRPALWIAHVLFSGTATPSMESVHLTMKKLTEDDIGAVRSYVEARNPIALLCHPAWRFVDATSHQQPRKKVSLAKNCKLFLNPARTRHAESMPLPATLQWVDVIQESDEFVDVVVPAYGQCRARKSDAVAWQEHESPREAESHTTFANHSIQSLKIWIRNSNFDVDAEADNGSAHVAAFLQLVGRPIRSVNVLCRTARGDQFLDAVWQACPNLRVLQLSKVRFPTLRYLVDAYETEKCRASSLQLSEFRVEDEDSIVDFILALEGPSHQSKVVATLRELTLGEDSFHAFLGHADYEEIAQVLQTNQTLRFVALELEPEDRKELQPRFRSLDGSVLQGQWDPLPMRCKCALLSVVECANDAVHGNGMPHASSIAQLDSGILGNILGFCVRPVTRSVVLKAM